MLKEEVCNYGIDNVGISGLVAVILDCNIPDKTMSILLGKNLRELAEMTPEELMALPGIGRAKAIRLAAAFELARRLANTMPEDRPSIRSPENAAVLVMGEMRHLDREHFWALLLNTKNRVIAREVISIGTLNSSAVHPRELFKAAIRRSAAAVILVHNHPSGDPTPSQQDIEVTKRMVEAGNIVGINVLDHLVIGDNQFVSLKAQGLM
ncbi:DNA repair protein RadC [Desulfallas sp. Bu1-1]|uniref:RadC family protein n=1 Tax=Desulfallas sp. Bu1-1 TaxID=2787620 RepID=UPI001FAC15FC|nr:DNA repair protein RadC [Desulfallas sp. Bu1-1]